MTKFSTWCLRYWLAITAFTISVCIAAVTISCFAFGNSYYHTVWHWQLCLAGAVIILFVMHLKENSQQEEKPVYPKQQKFVTMNESEEKPITKLSFNNPVNYMQVMCDKHTDKACGMLDTASEKGYCKDCIFDYNKNPLQYTYSPVDAWQTCPLCKGLGYAPCIGTSTEATETCTVCKGKKIINTFNGLPPNY